MKGAKKLAGDDNQRNKNKVLAKQTDQGLEEFIEKDIDNINYDKEISGDKSTRKMSKRLLNRDKQASKKEKKKLKFESNDKNNAEVVLPDISEGFKNKNLTIVDDKIILKKSATGAELSNSRMEN